MLRSAGRIADPFAEAVVGAPPPLLSLARLAAWSAALRAKNESAQALYRLSKLVKSHDADFSPAKLAQAAAANYAAVLEAASTGRLADARPLLTEQVYVLLRQGLAESVRETGARQGAVVVQHTATPTVVQARLVHLKPVGRMDPSARPDFAQLTIRHETLQRPVATAAAGGEGAASRGAGAAAGYVSDGEAETAQRSRGASMLSSDVVGEWVPVVHADSGATYWYHTHTKATTWTPPRPSQHVIRNAIRLDVAGCLRTPQVAGAASGALAAATRSDAGSVPLMRVVHHVVWEACLSPDASYVWRIAKM